MTDRRKWYHVILTTYAGWLHGDSRGFRTRHHREHIEGDYKNPPPPGRYADRERRSRESLRFDPAVIDGPWRERLGKAVLEKLQQCGALVICISVSKRHLHCVAKMPFEERRRWAGRAMRHAWFELRNHGWRTKLWGKRGKFLRIESRQHQIRAYRYVEKHRQREGAWVWTILEEKSKQRESRR